MKIIDFVWVADQKGFIPDSARNLSFPNPPGSVGIPVDVISVPRNKKPKRTYSEQESSESDHSEPLVETELESADTAKLGIEFYAWYTPFHRNLDHWGVYVRARGIELFGLKLNQAGVPWRECFDRAYELLLAHEQRHLEIEFKITEFEIIEDRHIYIAGREQQCRGSVWFNDEEAFCNLAMIESSRGNLNRVVKSIVSNPRIPGYSDWDLLEPLHPIERWGRILGKIIRNQGSFSIPSEKNFGAQVLKDNLAKIVCDGSGPSGRVSGPFSYN